MTTLRKYIKRKRLISPTQHEAIKKNYWIINSEFNETMSEKSGKLSLPVIADKNHIEFIHTELWQKNHNNFQKAGAE